jgi:Domain of unknown function (DUF4185)
MTATPLGWVTGEQSLNRTDINWSVGGTDLGILWDDGEDGILVAFGDTFYPRQPQGGGGGKDWRSNVLARSTDKDLTAGMRIDSFVTDRRGHAKEILPSKKIDNSEKTVIPTGGCSIGGRQYLAYMSVRRWGVAGRWVTNYAGLAYSDDRGENWVKLTGKGSPTWENLSGSEDHPFQMCTLVVEGEWVYFIGTPNGRAGAAYLSRVKLDDILEISRYQDWTGRHWEWAGPYGPGGYPGAVPVLPAPVGELSVAYHSAGQQWLATYYREADGGYQGTGNAIVYQTAPRITGPYSAPRVLVSGAEFPGLYGAYLHPWTMHDPEPCFIVSQWGPYNTILMRARIPPRKLSLWELLMKRFRRK